MLKEIRKDVFTQAEYARKLAKLEHGLTNKLN